MQSNQEAVQYLTAFIGSERADDHFVPLCKHCATAIPTEESKALVADAKAQAAQIIVELSGADAAPDAWATLVRGTIFDNWEAAEQRGDLTHFLLEMAANGVGLFGRPEYEDGWGRTGYETRVNYIRARTKNSNVNPFGLALPDHHALCPNKEPVKAQTPCLSLKDLIRLESNC
jgi:hypothetical protein